MPNKQQNSKIEHINKEINSLQDLIKKSIKKSESISMWVNANRKNTSKKRTKNKSFSHPKNTNYSEECIPK